MKRIMKLLLALMIIIGLTACGGSGGSKSGNESKDIVVWVGEESAEFYQKVVDEYVNKQSDFPYTITVKGMDTGAVAGTVTNDPSAAADIYTTAHDIVDTTTINQLQWNQIVLEVYYDPREKRNYKTATLK